MANLEMPVIGGFAVYDEISEVPRHCTVHKFQEPIYDDALACGATSGEAPGK